MHTIPPDGSSEVMPPPLSIRRGEPVAVAPASNYSVRFVAEHPRGAASGDSGDAVYRVSDDGMFPVTVAVARRSGVLGVLPIGGNLLRSYAEFVAFDMDPATSADLCALLERDPRDPRVSLRDGLFSVLLGSRLQMWSVPQGSCLFDAKDVVDDGEQMVAAFRRDWKTPVVAIMCTSGKLICFNAFAGSLKMITLRERLAPGATLGMRLCWIEHCNLLMLCCVCAGSLWLYHVHDDFGPVVYRTMNEISGVPAALAESTSELEQNAQTRFSAFLDGTGDTEGNAAWKVQATDIVKRDALASKAAVIFVESRSKHITIGLKAADGRSWISTVACPEVHGFFSFLVLPDLGPIAASKVLEPRSAKPERGAVTGACAVTEPGTMVPTSTVVAHLDGTVAMFDSKTVHMVRLKEVQGAASVQLLCSRCGGIVYLVTKGKLYVLIRERAAAP